MRLSKIEQDIESAQITLDTNGFQIEYGKDADDSILFNKVSEYLSQKDGHYGFCIVDETYSTVILDAKQNPTDPMYYIVYYSVRLDWHSNSIYDIIDGLNTPNDAEHVRTMVLGLMKALDEESGANKLTRNELDQLTDDDIEDIMDWKRKFLNGV